MNRITAFTSRNLKEMLRDPLSYIFCLGFPLVMLVIMTLVNESIPAQAGMTIFRIDRLSGGIAVFGLTFVMLFAAMNTAKDRSGAFLTRLYATPMQPADFAAGYLLPMLAVSVIQGVITFLASLVTAAIAGESLSVCGLLAALAALLPSAVMFVGFGFLFGTLFNEKSAPGICSIIISLGSFLGCIWFDAEQTGGVMLKICRCLPFYYCTKSVRAATVLDLSAENFWIPLLVVTLTVAAVTAAAIFAFRRKMKQN